MNFWNRKEDSKLKSEEYEILLKKIVAIEANIDSLKHKYILNETEIADVRNKVLKKLNLLRQKEEEEEEKPKNTKNFNSLNPFSI